MGWHDLLAWLDLMGRLMFVHMSRFCRILLSLQTIFHARIFKTKCYLILLIRIFNNFDFLLIYYFLFNIILLKIQLIYLTWLQLIQCVIWDNFFGFSFIIWDFSVPKLFELVLFEVEFQIILKVILICVNLCWVFQKSIFVLNMSLREHLLFFLVI